MASSFRSRMLETAGADVLDLSAEWTSCASVARTATTRRLWLLLQAAVHLSLLLLGTPTR